MKTSTSGPVQMSHMIQNNQASMKEEATQPPGVSQTYTTTSSVSQHIGQQHVNPPHVSVAQGFPRVDNTGTPSPGSTDIVQTVSTAQMQIQSQLQEAANINFPSSISLPHKSAPCTSSPQNFSTVNGQDSKNGLARAACTTAGAALGHVATKAVLATPSLTTMSTAGTLSTVVKTITGTQPTIILTPSIAGPKQPTVKSSTVLSGTTLTKLLKTTAASAVQAVSAPQLALRQPGLVLATRAGHSLVLPASHTATAQTPPQATGEPASSTLQAAPDIKPTLIMPGTAQALTIPGVGTVIQGLPHQLHGLLSSNGQFQLVGSHLVGGQLVQATSQGGLLQAAVAGASMPETQTLVVSQASQASPQEPTAVVLPKEESPPVHQAASLLVPQHNQVTTFKPEINIDSSDSPQEQEMLVVATPSTELSTATQVMTAEVTGLNATLSMVAPDEVKQEDLGASCDNQDILTTENTMTNDPFMSPMSDHMYVSMHARDYVSPLPSQSSGPDEEASTDSMSMPTSVQASMMLSADMAQASPVSLSEQNGDSSGELPQPISKPHMVVTPAAFPDHQHYVSDSDVIKKKKLTKKKGVKSGSGGQVSSEADRPTDKITTTGQQAATKVKHGHGSSSASSTPHTQAKPSLEPIVTLDGLPPWAQQLGNLWKFMKPDLGVEQKFNEERSKKYPYCAVCSLFKVEQSNEENKSPNKKSTPKKSKKKKDDKETGIPLRSTPVMPEQCFNVRAGGPSPFGSSTPLFDDEGKSPLLVCDNCKVCVHASCYGVVEMPDSGTWRCTRCVKQKQYADCCLCMLRGGALKPTTCGQWCHIVCALTIVNVTFDDLVLREPINVRKIESARLKLKCQYCYETAKLVKRADFRIGACAQCSAGKCTTSFHVLCAREAGVSFETSDWPFPIYISCLRHASKEHEGKNRVMKQVKIGDTVITKHKNGRYYKCEVVDIGTQVFYEVDFEDGSFSDDLFPEDIENHDCLSRGPPKKRARVKVRWPDGELYNATFRGTNSHLMYTVEFEDTSELTVKREDLWSQDEELPKKVLNRMSKATERKHDLFYEGEILEKRTRHVNTRYLKDAAVF